MMIKNNRYLFELHEKVFTMHFKIYKKNMSRKKFIKEDITKNNGTQIARRR